jgi:hypothetical protein
MSTVKVVSISEGSYFVGKDISGSTDDYVLSKGKELVKCVGILYLEDDELEDYFEMWNDAFYSNEEGYFKFDYKSGKWIEGCYFEESVGYDFGV